MTVSHSVSRAAAGYVDFLQRRHWFVVGAWVCLMGMGCYFAPLFMGNTVSSFDAPKGSLSYDAAAAMEEFFPGSSATTPLLVVISTTDGTSVLTPQVQQFSTDFAKLVTDSPYKDALVGEVAGYFYATAPGVGLYTLAKEFVSASNASTIISCVVDSDSDDSGGLQDDIVSAAHTLRKGLGEQYRVEVTGELVFFDDIRDGAEHDMVRVDGIALPIALLVLAGVLRSPRLILMPLLSILATVLVSFTLMYPISLAIDVISVTPSLMMSMVVALSIDYSLFLFSRFVEELTARQPCPHAIRIALKTAGETILVSGTTLCICFLGLTLLPLTLLQTMGLGAACAVVTAMLVSLNLVPALVFCFPVFFGNCLRNDFAVLWGKVKGCFRRGNSNQPNRAQLLSVMHTSQYDQPSAMQRSHWYRLTVFTIRHRYVVFALLVLSMAPFIWCASRMRTSNEITLSVPRGVESVDAYHHVSDDFGAGTLAPYTLLLVAPDGQAMTQDFFTEARHVLEALLEVPDTTINRLTGLLVFNSTFVDFATANKTLHSWPVTEKDRSLFFLANDFTNMDNLDFATGTAQTVEIVLGINPYANRGKSWLHHARKALEDVDTPLDVYLAGGASAQLDGVALVYKLLPMEIGVTAAVVFVLMGVAFRSLVVPLRSIFSIALTMAWTYGIATLVYNNGILNWLGWPAVHSEDGVSWFTPVMCFSVLTGFGLDYDIFLLTRIVEFREQAYTELSSIKLGVYKTGGIITAAGCIMTIAFAGLLLSSMPLLNMCAFFLAFSVLFDTFVVRTVLVPAAMAILGSLNFWPRRLPVATLEEGLEIRGVDS